MSFRLATKKKLFLKKGLHCASKNNQHEKKLNKKRLQKKNTRNKKVNTILYILR